MDLLRDYWWLIVISLALILALVLLRPRQRVRLTDSAPVRPHMAHSRKETALGHEAEVSTKAVVGTQRAIDPSAGGTREDDFCRMKGVGPKFADALHGLGFTRFDQLAHLTPTEIDRIDVQMGAFSGRLTRDRVVEQADYLARNDIDGYEQTFGKL